MATIESLLMTPGQHFSSLSTVLPDLRQHGFKQPSSAEEDAFQQQEYNRYLLILLDHISGRFPDAALIEAFSVFDPAKIPLNFSVQDAASHGVDALTRLTEYYGPHNVVDSEAAKSELRTFICIVAINQELRQLATHQIMSLLQKKEELQDMLPNLSRLAAIGLLLPMPTVDCEREFSTLKRIKTDLRNRLSSMTLQNLMMISVEGPEPSDFPYDRACDLWSG